MTGVIFFGGDKITLTVATRGVNRGFVRQKSVTENFSGIVRGEFVDATEIPEVFARLLSGIRPYTFSRLVIATPSEFCSVALESRQKIFTKPQKISAGDISGICNGGSAVYFRVDDGKPTLDIRGSIVENKLEAQVSHIEIDQSFLQVVRTCLPSRLREHAQFMPTVLAESLYLVDQPTRDRSCVLISCKMFSTAVAVVSGDTIVALETFYMGSAHFVNDIMAFLRTDFQTANDKFTAYRGQRDGIYPIIKARLDDIAEQIFATVNGIDRDLYKRAFFMTGGHTDAVPNAKEIFEKALGVSVTALAHPLDETNAPDHASHDAVVSLSV